MVMWERRLQPSSMLAVKDTEDTKDMANLVLTVQQPGQTNQPPAQNAGELS